MRCIGTTFNADIKEARFIGRAFLKCTKVMKILLTGATGYIGRRLLPVLLEQGHTVVCAVRDTGRLDLKKYKADQVSLVEADLLNAKSLKALPKEIERAYY